MSALGSGCRSEISAEMESCEIPVELGAIVGRAYWVPDTFGTDTAEPKKCVKKYPLFSPLMGGREGTFLRYTYVIYICTLSSTTRLVLKSEHSLSEAQFHAQTFTAIDYFDIAWLKMRAIIANKKFNHYINITDSR
jgi:hypothetical protein